MASDTERETAHARPQVDGAVLPLYIDVSIYSKSTSLASAVAVSLPCCFKYSCWHKKKHLTRIYNKGEKRIYRDLNVYHLIKRVNQLENVTYL